MYDSAPPTQPTKSQAASLLGPGITGLFIQGIESGLVLAEFCWWFSNARRERHLVSVIVVFVTVVGLTQSGLYFASSWTDYVQKLEIGLGPNWENSAQIIPTLLISVPVQSLMIGRCYYLVGNNMFIITPLLLLLVASTVTSIWSIVLFVNCLIHPSLALHRSSISLNGLYLSSLLLPTVLDIVLTGIILCHLTRKKKQVYSAGARKQISRFVNIVWQSALPPTICAICVSGFYIPFLTADTNKPQGWLMAIQPAIQPAIGKLYALSLFSLINARHLQQPDERHTALISTLTVPREAGTTLTQGGRVPVGGDECREIAVADYGHEKTVGFAV